LAIVTRFKSFVSNATYDQEWKRIVLPAKDWMRSTIERKRTLSILGPLETEVMQILWTRNEVSTGQVWEELRKRRDIALTTVSGTLNRLYEKGLLYREVGKGKRGLSYVYRPKMGESKFKQFIAERITRQLLKEYEGPTVSTLINTLAHDPDKLEELRRKLEALSKEKRRTP
jgi:predicted transcriptional regulator